MSGRQHYKSSPRVPTRQVIRNAQKAMRSHAKSVMFKSYSSPVSLEWSCHRRMVEEKKLGEGEEEGMAWWLWKERREEREKGRDMDMEGEEGEGGEEKCNTMHAVERKQKN